MRNTLRTAVLVGLSAGALALTGCAADGNKGADTTCKDYRAADSATQSEMVSKMLKEQKGSEPSNGEVTLTKLSVSGYCASVGSDSSKISQIDGS